VLLKLKNETKSNFEIAERTYEFVLYDLFSNRKPWLKFMSYLRTGYFFIFTTVWIPWSCVK